MAVFAIRTVVSVIRRCGAPALMLATLLGAAVLAAGCADSGGAAPDDATDASGVDTTDVDLADGAFERNDAGRTDGDFDSDDSDDSDAGSDVDSDSDAGDTPVASDEDAATPTSVDAATDGADTGDDIDIDDKSSTDGSTAPTGGAGSSTGGATTGPVLAPAVQPGEGVIVVGGATYLFPATTCEISDTIVVVEGEGTSSSFSGFQASIYYERADLDDDGQEDVALDVVVDFEPTTSGDTDEVPELYAGKVDSQTFVSGADITVTVDGQRIHGGGLMTDFNGVVFPVDEPGPMAFDVRCAEL